MTWVKNIDELLAELEMLGYTVKRGKYISVKAPDQKRAVRLQTLGADYTAESLSSRILWRDVGSGTVSPCANSPLRNSYNSVINEGEGKGINLHKLSALLTIINRDNLRSIGEVEGKIEQLKFELELLAELEHLGYTVKRGKYISVKAPEQQRAVRLKTLGEDYTVEQIASRILWRDVGAGLNNPCERSALRDKYSETISVVQKVNSSHPTLEQLGTLLTVINRDNLQSIGELEGKVEQIKFELEKSRLEVNTMETKCNLLRSLAVQAEEYFTLIDKQSLTSEEQLRVKMYKETLAQKNIESRSDLDYLNGVIVEAEQKAAPIRNHYNKCAELFREYTDISETYNQISQGDYISKIIEQQQQKKPDEPQACPRR